MNELGSDLCLFTETWFKDNEQINSILEDFTNQHSCAFLRKDRPGLRRGGGVAICFNTKKISFQKAKIPPSKHEVFAAVGKRVGQRRKIVAVVIYVPPFYNADQNRSLLSYVNDALTALKAKYDDPYFIVGGDFNRRSYKDATKDHPDIKPADWSHQGWSNPRPNWFKHE